MKHFKNNRYLITAATIIFTLAIMISAASSMVTAPAAATVTTTEEPTTTTTTPPEGIELSAQPVYQEQSRVVSENLINETHVETTLTANGRLTLPNTTETIDTTATGSVLSSLADGTAIGQEVITTEDGTESATAKFFGIARFNMEEGTGRAIVISLVDTNSTGRLAVLDGMILTGQIEFQPDQTGLLTLWEWQSGIPLPSMSSTAGQPPLANTSMTTNATSTDTNATATTAPPEEDEEGGDQQQQTTTIAPNPLFE